MNRIRLWHTHSSSSQNTVSERWIFGNAAVRPSTTAKRATTSIRRNDSGDFIRTSFPVILRNDASLCIKKHISLFILEKAS